MMKKWGNKCKIILLLVFTLFLIGCRGFDYVGNYPELYSVAINSLLGARGYGDNKTQPIITTLEEDRYGRILFSYSEGYAIGAGFSYGIMQKVEGNYVYFYPHYNFILRNWGHFTSEDVETLKEVNSWNQPMSDSNEFVRVRIVRQKEEGPISESDLVDMYRLVFPNLNLSRGQIIPHVVFLRADDYGRSIYLASRREIHIAVLFQPDHSFDLETGTLLIEDHNNYQTELRLWMEANGWNTPWEE